LTETASRPGRDRELQQDVMERQAMIVSLQEKLHLAEESKMELEAMTRRLNDIQVREKRLSQQNQRLSSENMELHRQILCLKHQSLPISITTTDDAMERLCAQNKSLNEELMQAQMECLSHKEQMLEREVLQHQLTNLEEQHKTLIPQQNSQIRQFAQELRSAQEQALCLTPNCSASDVAAYCKLQTTYNKLRTQHGLTSTRLDTMTIELEGAKVAKILLQKGLDSLSEDMLQMIAELSQARQRAREADILEARLCFHEGGEAAPHKLATSSSDEMAELQAHLDDCQAEIVRLKQKSRELLDCTENSKVLQTVNIIWEESQDYLTTLCYKLHDELGEAQTRMQMAGIQQDVSLDPVQESAYLLKEKARAAACEVEVQTMQLLLEGHTSQATRLQDQMEQLKTEIAQMTAGDRRVLQMQVSELEHKLQAVGTTNAAEFRQQIHALEQAEAAQQELLKRTQEEFEQQGIVLKRRIADLENMNKNLKEQVEVLLSADELSPIHTRG